MALFKNLHCLLLFLNRIFNGDGPGRASGKVEGVGQSRPAGAETRRHSVRGLGRGWVSFHSSSPGSDGDGNDNAILMWRDEGAQLKYISRGALPGTFLWPRRGWCLAKSLPPQDPSLKMGLKPRDGEVVGIAHPAGCHPEVGCTGMSIPPRWDLGPPRLCKGSWSGVGEG